MTVLKYYLFYILKMTSDPLSEPLPEPLSDPDPDPDPSINHDKLVYKSAGNYIITLKLEHFVQNE